MPSLGQKLRARREQLGLSIGDIAVSTRIREAYLEAIEQDRLETIPGGFFSRAFVRQYASVLGLRGSEVEADLSAVTTAPDDAANVRKLIDEYRPSAGRGPAGLVLDDDDEPRDYFHEAAFLKEPRFTKKWMAMAVLLILGSAGYLASIQRPELVDEVRARIVAYLSPSGRSSPAVATSSVPVSQTASVSLPEAPLAAQPDAAASVADTVSQSPVTTPAVTPAPAQHTPAPAGTPGSPVQVAVVAKEKSWVRLIQDGTKTFGGVMEAGESRTLSGSQSAVVFTGNAGGLEVTYNGRSLGTVGPRGQVRTAVFTPANYEVRLGNGTNSSATPNEPSKPSAPPAS
jgi:cytoskeleton protein RodZ